jgi:hypothetical protein
VSWSSDPLGLILGLAFGAVAILAAVMFVADILGNERE